MKRAFVQKKRNLYRDGMNALIDRLGLSGAIEFLRESRIGRGDYTRERHRWLDDETVDEIAQRVFERQRRSRRRGVRSPGVRRQRLRTGAGGSTR